MQYLSKNVAGSAVFLCLIFFCSRAVLADDKWLPVSPEELSMKQGKVEADADAEAIFWEVRVADEFVPRAGFQTVMKHYLRIKILTDRGRDDNSKVDIPFGKAQFLPGKIEISQLEARTTKPDGTTVLLNEKDIFEREIVKGEGIKLKARSFVVPGIETGAVIEYRWKEVRKNSLSFYVPLQIAREIPVETMKYYLKPVAAPGFPLAMRIHSFNIYSRLVKESGGFYSTTFTDIRSFREEPHMPPEYVVRPWLLVYYVDDRTDSSVSQNEYWQDLAKRTYEYHKSIFKDDKNIKLKAQQVIGDSAEPLDKVRRIVNFVRRSIRNVDDDAIKSDEREKIKENKTEADTLQRGQGTGHDIEMLAAAMLNAAGFEVRFANIAVRRNPRFLRNLLNDYLLQSETLAVKINGAWQYFEPASQHLPFGMLPWSFEGQTTLISDPTALIWSNAPNSNADRSLQKRIVRMKMDEDGTIEGAVTIEFTGHLAEFYKEAMDEDSPAEREKAIIEMVKARIAGTAEVTAVSVENINDPEMPLVYRFKVRVPAYGELTGKRIFLRSNIFARKTKALFESGSRRNDIFFYYPWSEQDEVTVEIPAGYAVEISDPPKPISDSRSLGLHKTEIQFDEKTGILSYKREFSFGRTGELEFGVQAYSRLKDLFDSYHKADQHAVTLLKVELLRF